MGEAVKIELPPELIAELDALPQSKVSRGHKWTEQEDDVIRYAYRKTNKAALAQWFGMSRESLRKRAVELGVIQ